MMKSLQIIKVASVLSLALVLSACTTKVPEDQTDDAMSSAGVTTISGAEDTANTSGLAGNDANLVNGVNNNGYMTEAQKQAQQEQIRQQQRSVFFAFDNTQISDEYIPMLTAHATYLRSHPMVKAVIEGHTDERGTPEYNIALGERRAQVVAQYLQSLGVLSNQLSIISYGEEKPLDRSQTEAAYAKNRRAVITY